MNPVYTAPDQAIIRSRYRATDTVYFDPCVVVFQAKVATAITSGDTYLSINYNTVSVGAYTDIKIGQMLVITATSDHTIPLRGFREMRVAAAPTGSVIPINESEFALTTAMYITVIDTYKPLQRARQGALVDGRLAYQGLPATITGLPSAIVIESTGDGTYDFANVGIQCFTGITVTSTLYDFPGGTYDTGSATDLDPVVTMPADSHTWCRLSYVLSNGVTNYMTFQFIVQDPENPTLATQSIKPLNLTRNWTGHHATCTAFRGASMTEVMNGTRCVVVSRRAYDDGLLADAMDNVVFVGYLSKGTDNTQSITDKSVSFDIAGIWEIAGQLPMSQIAIRDDATPDTWDDMDLPTPQRVATHVLARYSTVINLCSLNLDVLDDTWFGGDMNVPSNSLGDAIEQVLSEINAQIIQNPSGELFLRRDLRFETTAVRDAADVVWAFSEADLRSLNVTTRYEEKTGRIIVGFRKFDTTRAPSKGGKAVAPAVILGTSPETQTRPNQLMHADLTDAQLLAEAQERTGNLLAAENPPYDIGGSTMPSLSWLTPSCAQWVTIDLEASATTRGQAISIRALIAGIDLAYLSAEGSHDVSIEFLPETQGGAALIVAALARNVTSLTMFVLPPLSAYGGNYGGPSSLNSSSGSFPPFRRENMGGMGEPVPADQAYDEGQYMPPVGTRSFAISFAISSNVAAGFISVGPPTPATYTIDVAGWAEMEQPFPGCENLRLSQGLWVPRTGFGIYDPGGGLGPAFYTPNWYWGWIKNPTAYSVAIYKIVATFNEVVNGLRFNNSLGTWTQTVPASEIELTDVTAPGLLPFVSNVHGLEIGFYPSYISPTTTLRMTGFCMYASVVPTGVKWDAFYQYEEDEGGNPINWSLLGALKGLFIDNATATGAVPLFNPNHEYTFTWPGSGGNPLFKIQDTIYGDNANKPLTIRIEGPNAGT